MREPLSCYSHSAPGIQKLAITGSEKRGRLDQNTGEESFLRRMGCPVPARLRVLRPTIADAGRFPSLLNLPPGPGTID